MIIAESVEMCAAHNLGDPKATVGWSPSELHVAFVGIAPASVVPAP
jgi:hypothetical protein